MRPARRLCLGLFMSGVLAFTAACTGPEKNASEPSGTETPAEPSGRETVTSGGLARKAILPKDQLPVGWRYATDEQFLGKPEICGVLLEPPGLKTATTQRLTNIAGSDRSVIQYSFDSNDEAATAERIDEFASAALTCSSSAASDDQSSDLTVEPITAISPIGQSFGAVHAYVTETPENRRDYVAFRNGTHVTVLLSYGLAELASHEDLTKIAEAVNTHVAEVTK